MKKKVLLVVMCISILMLAGGCSKKTDTNDSNISGTPVPTSAVVPSSALIVTKGEYVLNDYIKLGQYKGIEVTVEQLEVTDADVETAVKDDMITNATPVEVTGRAVETGDIVNIDYEGLKDGIAFDNGTATAYDLTIGAGKFIPGFEDQLIGANIGDKLELNITFPADYTDTTLAGQPVVFKVTVNSIKKIPELTEEYVKANTESDSIAAYKESIKAGLQATNVTTMANQKTSSVFSKIVENSKISSLPQTLLDYYTAARKDYYNQTATSYGVDLATFLSAYQITQEQFDSEIKAYAEAMSTQEIVLKAIIAAEKFELTDAEYQAGITQIVADYGYASEEEFLQSAEEAQIKEYLLWQKTMDFITEQSVEV